MDVRLIGTEDVIRAGHVMKGAADTMLAAARNMDAALVSHQRFMDDWLQRFDAVIAKQRAA